MIERIVPVDTARLAVRRVGHRDLDDLAAVNGDDETTRFLPTETWRTRDDAERWYARIAGLEETGTLRQFVVVERAAARVVGAIVVFRIDPDNRRAEIGYVLGRRDRGRGLMREALTGLLASLFADVGLNRVEAMIDPRNAASRRLVEKLGFRHEGTLRERGVLKGEPVDSDVFGLLARDFVPSGHVEMADR